MKIWKVFIEPQIKSAHSGYQDDSIRIMSIQNKSSQLCIFFRHAHHAIEVGLDMINHIKEVTIKFYIQILIKSNKFF